MYTAYPPAAAPSGLRGWLNRAEAWLDARGKGAWIATMVLSFILFWPLGLLMLAYMLFNGKFGSRYRPDGKETFMFCNRHRHAHRHGMMREALRPSGNTAFDAYKAETLRRLEEEQTAFEAFLQRLREAKDKSEFDAFMDERACATPATTEARPVDPAAPGAY